MNWLTRQLARFRKAAKPQTRKAFRWQPSVELLEDRLVPSTVSKVTASFNGTAIAAGSTVWFNASALSISGMPSGTTTATVHVEEAAIDFTAAGTAYHVPVPNGVVVFTKNATSAAASFDPNDNDWDVSGPASGDDVFMTGAALQVANGLPGGIKNVSFSAAFWSDTAGITVNWSWAAAVYKNFSADNNALGIKPVDDNTLSIYKNKDQSGTPEAFKAFIAAGGTGGGGTNYTGNFAGGVNVKPSLGNGLSDYPYPSSNPLTSIAFNESTVVKAASMDLVNGTFQVWYSDEHALALGVRQVNVKTAAGITTTNYDITPLTTNPGVALNAAVGTTATTGDQAGTDLSGRPVYPSLFISDTTTDPNNRSGDWQWGGNAIAPGAVFGTWKGAVRTVDYTTATPTVTVTCDVDPVKNNWNLGAGSDAPPAGTATEGYGAEVRWSLADLQSQGYIVPGHTYRFYVIVHDGDQNKSGGDCGQASFTYSIPAPVTASISGFVNGNGSGLLGVTITLMGTTNSGQQVLLTTVTAADGSFSFGNLAAGTYSIAETSGLDTSFYTQRNTSIGTVNGTADGTSTSDTSIGSIVLNAGDAGINYNFFNVHMGE